MPVKVLKTAAGHVRTNPGVQNRSPACAPPHAALVPDTADFVELVMSEDSA